MSIGDFARRRDAKPITGLRRSRNNALSPVFYRFFVRVNQRRSVPGIEECRDVSLCELDAGVPFSIGAPACELVIESLAQNGALAARNPSEVTVSL